MYPIRNGFQCNSNYVRVMHHPEYIYLKKCTANPEYADLQKHDVHYKAQFCDFFARSRNVFRNQGNQIKKCNDYSGIVQIY